MLIRPNPKHGSKTANNKCKIAVVYYICEQRHHTQKTAKSEKGVTAAIDILAMCTKYYCTSY